MAKKKSLKKSTAKKKPASIKKPVKKKKPAIMPKKKTPNFGNIKKRLAPSKSKIPQRSGETRITITEFCKSKGMRPGHVEGFRTFCKSQGLDPSTKAMIERNGLEKVYLAYGGK